MAGSLTRRVFFMLVFLTFLHPDCSRSFFRREVSRFEKNAENLKCETMQINGKDSRHQLTGFVGFTNQISPIDRIVPEGGNFTYQCCGENRFKNNNNNNNNKAIFKWGLYEQGVASPSSLYSRVEVNSAGSFCSVSWALEFINSVYSERTSAEYNTSSHCVLWIISNVTMNDNNTFVAIFRDNFTLGTFFKDCTPVSLNILKAATPTTPPTQPTQPTQQTQRQLPTVKSTSQNPFHTPSGPTYSTNTTAISPYWVAFGLIMVLAIAAIIFLVVKKRPWEQCQHWRETLSQVNNDGEEDGINESLRFIDNVWSRDFNVSRYKGRIKMAFNSKTLCMAWTISGVRKKDENTFFAVYRDDPGRGKQFVPCNITLKLAVLDVRSFSKASTPPKIEVDTPPSTEESHVTQRPTTDDDIEDSPDPPLETVTDDPEDSLNWIIGVIAAVIVFGLIIGSIMWFKRPIFQWFDSARVRFKDRAINAQEMTRRSRKRLIRRRRTNVQIT